MSTQQKNLSMTQVLVCGAAVVTLSMGIRHGFGLWLQPITQDQGWTRQTFALAIATMVMVQIWGFRYLGGSYFRKFWNFSGPNGFMKGINGFVGILELISEFARIIAFGFRLFGNIFAGEIVLATMAFLVAFLLPVPFYALEVFVGFVQALVFMMLALVFFQMATISHGGHDEHH